MSRHTNCKVLLTIKILFWFQCALSAQCGAFVSIVFCFVFDLESKDPGFDPWPIPKNAVMSICKYLPFFELSLMLYLRLFVVAISLY